LNAASQTNLSGKGESGKILFETLVAILGLLEHVEIELKE